MTLELLVGFFAGIAGGLAYFRTLWWTVRRVANAVRPAGLVVASYVARLVFVFLGAAALGSWSVTALLAATVGFLVARRVVIRSVEVTA
jgi:F1F0 ATPase subunit 2